MSSKKRYSEIPNTPTPFSKTHSDVKVGSKLMISNIGKVILRYVGTVEGKAGKFAGMELLGESVSFGKNSGDVNGKFYFRTKVPGAGLFMNYDKLVNAIEFTESPPTSRKQPAMINHSENPADQFSPQPTAPLSSKRLSTRRQSLALRGGSQADAVTPISSNRPKEVMASPLEEELQRVTSDKIIVESQKQNLQQEISLLKNEINELTSKVKNNEKLIQEFDFRNKELQKLIDVSNEKTKASEAKLIKQRKVYEGQREELLDIIDQLESQVGDNETLYLGELSKLQQEIEEQKSHIEKLTSSEANSELLEGKDQKLFILMEELDRAKCTIESLNKTVQNHEEQTLELSSRTNTNVDVSKELEKKDSEISTLTLELEKLSTYNSKLLNDNEKLKSLEGKLKFLENQIQGNQNFEKENLELKRKLKEIDLPALQKKLKNYEETMDRFKDQENQALESSLSEELSALKKKLNDKDSEIQQQKSRMESYEKEIYQLKTLEHLQSENKDDRALKDFEEKVAILEFRNQELEKEKELSVQKDGKITNLQNTVQNLNLTLESKVDEAQTINELKSQLILKDEEINKLSYQTQETSQISKAHDSIEMEEKNLEIELLKEEILELKSKFNENHIQELESEIQKLKNLSKPTTNNELNEQIRILQLELKKKPSQREYQEMKSELGLIDGLRKVETKNKDREIRELKSKIKELMASRVTSEGTETPQKSNARSTMGELSLNRPPVFSQVIDGALQVYVPENKNPTNGRKLWCGLCEREGHDSIDCPYENDIF